MISRSIPPYFNRYRSQGKFHAATLEDDFFDEWFNTLYFNAHEPVLTGSRTGTVLHLLNHKNCPQKYRDIFADHSRASIRLAALMPSPSGDIELKYKNIDIVLQDSAKRTVADKVIGNLFVDLNMNRPVPPKVIIKIVDHSRSMIVSAKPNENVSPYWKGVLVAFYAVLTEQEAALVNPSAFIRGMAASFVYHDYIQAAKELYPNPADIFSIPWENTIKKIAFPNAAENFLLSIEKNLTSDLYL